MEISRITNQTAPPSYASEQVSKGNEGSAGRNLTQATVVASDSGTLSAVTDSKKIDNSQDPKTLQAAVDSVQKFVNPITDNAIRFSVDRNYDNTMVVQVVDRDTGDVIRQIPSEEMLKLAKALDQLQGLLIKQQA